MARSAPRHFGSIRASPDRAEDDAGGLWPMGRDMLSEGRNRLGQFWWRAAEPIPARPAPLASKPTGSLEAGEGDFEASKASADPSPPCGNDDYRDQVTMADLGAVRPLDNSHPATGLEELDHGERRRGYVRRDGRQWLTSLANHLGRSRPQIYGPRSAHSLFAGRRVLLAAGAAGAIVFASATGFGQHVRPSSSVFPDLDRLLARAGLGINEIGITGQRHTPDRDIFRALDAGNASLLFFDVAAARHRIEALPWIESASLVRVLPDKLKVEVRERQAAAVWLDGDRVALVDLTGRLLAHVASYVPSELPRISGAGAPKAAAELISALAYHPDIAARMRVAHRIGERRWDLELSNSIRVLMASGPSLRSLQRLVDLNQETLVLEQANHVIDLTQSQSIAVSSPAAPASIHRQTGARQAPPRPL